MTEELFLQMHSLTVRTKQNLVFLPPVATEELQGEGQVGGGEPVLGVRSPVLISRSPASAGQGVLPSKRSRVGQIWMILCANPLSDFGN